MNTSRLFDIGLKTAYTIGFLFVAIVAVTGAYYYQLSVGDRPYHSMHQALKPGGTWGHGLGIVGSTMILLLFLYSLRKRRKFGLRFGPLRRWLDIHIFFGVMGPLLITLHTALKFNGIVSISFYSMVMVVLSGIFGRYVYIQIPRDSRGHALDLRASEERLRELSVTIKERLPASAAGLVEKVATQTPDKSGFAAVVATVNHDLHLWASSRGLRRKLRAHGVPAHTTNEIVKLMGARSVLERRITKLDRMTRLLHYWHVFHKPFAYIMIIIMIIHVAVAISFGYTWVL